MSATTDVATAIVNKFNSTGALLAAVPGGITADRDRSPSDGSAKSKPYLTFTVVQARPRQQSTCGDYVDFRLVVMTVHGTDKDELGEVVTLLHTTYDSPAVLDFSFSPKVVGHLRTEPLDEEDAIERGKYLGLDFRNANIAFVVWTHRTGG